MTKRHSAEQIVAKLRQADLELTGMSVDQDFGWLQAVCLQHASNYSGVTELGEMLVYPK